MRYKKSLIHVRLNDQTHHQLKVICAQKGETIQTFVERVVEQALSLTENPVPPAVLENSIPTAGNASVAEQSVQYSVSDVDQQTSTEPDQDSLYVNTEGLPDEEAKTLTMLSEVDWTFADADTREHVHGIHPYPAKFIPQIPRSLIQALHPKDGSSTLDPFCGSGTALLESILLGIPAIGIDVNPLAVLISRVKTTPLNESLDSAIASITQQSRLRLSSDRSITVPEIPRIDHWFKPEIAEIVAILVEEIERAQVDDTSRDVLRIALSSILVRVSNQESDVRYAAIDKPTVPEGVITLFERSAFQISRQLSELFLLPLFPELRPAEAKVHKLDTRTLHANLPPWQVGLIVTSPPYPNAYEYWLYHKYRMYWLGMDPITARRDEMGARPHYSKKNGLTADDFANNMSQCFRAFSALLPHGRYACFLIGNSRIRGTYVDNAALLVNVASEHGFLLRAKLPRRIPSSRKSFNPSIGSIKTEKLLIFQRV